MKITTKSKDIDFSRVVSFYYVTTFQEIAEMADKNKNTVPILLYNPKSESGILFLMGQGDVKDAV